jgi:NhaP-type Na+/H+ or K+/H+ antiporter
MAETWQAVGIVLGVLIFAVGVAVLTRLFSVHRLEGQTFSMVVLGVAGVIGIAGFRIGWDVVGFLSMCFSVAAIPMGIEYYGRVIEEQKKANEEAKRMIDGNTSADR